MGRQSCHPGSGLIRRCIRGCCADFHRVSYNFLGVLCVVAGAVLLSSAPALAARGHVFSSAFGKAGSGNGEFSEPSGVAVNESSGDVYVVDKGNNRVEYFTASGGYLGQFNGSGSLPGEGSGFPLGVFPGQFFAPEGIAIDNSCQLHKPALTEATTPTCNQFDPSDGDVYVVDTGHSVIDKFSSTGHYEGQLTGTCAAAGTCPGSVIPFSDLEGVGVDANGELWVYFGTQVANYSNAVANEFIATREVKGFGFSEPGFAVDSKDNLYAHINGLFPETNIIYKFDSEGKELNGHELENTLDSEPPTGVAVELSNGDVYIDNTTTMARFTSEGALIEHLGSGHMTNGSGIGVNSTAEEVYVSDSAANTVDIFTPNPPGLPTVESESASEVASGSATFAAQINPQGESTEYRFEYDTNEYTPNGPPHGTTVPIPDASIGSGFEVHEVSVHRQDLLPHTTYHFRVVAHNKLGTVDGPDQTFITQSVGGDFVLPDGRVWELVSPPSTHGALISPIFRAGVIQASEDGSAMTYVASAPIGAEPKGNSNDTQVFSKRGPGGWSSQDIATPHDPPGAESVAQGQEYRFFSSDLSLGLVEPFGEATPLPPANEVLERDVYLRDDVDGNYQPLVTVANVPAGTKFGGNSNPHDGLGDIEFVDATPDLSHVVLSSAVALTSPPVEQGLYEWAGGQLQLINVLPESEGGIPASGAELGFAGGKDARHAISNGGSHVIWDGETKEHDGMPHLYMRDTATRETVRLDEVEKGAAGGGGDPKFQTASESGSKVFFTDEQQLTVGSTAKSGDPDLYVYEVTSSEGEPLAGKLTDLTVDPHAGESADVQGWVMGASEDGSYVYFVADGVLTPATTSGHCKGNATPVGATCNLYEVHYNGTGWDKPTFIAVLSGEDGNDWEAEEGQEGLNSVTSRVSPSGRYLAFMSDRSLTGYDNRDANSGESDEEVFLYAASSNRMVCPSCDPTGARPVGIEVASGVGPLVDQVGGPVWTGRWLAGNIPGWTPFVEDTARYQSRYLSDSGRLFFDSSDGLVPQHTNGVENVYEYEPEGEGSCESSSAIFSERSGGCVGLISSGSSGEESAFLDASASGDDVFFLTTSQLAPQDGDTAYHVYDAHVCSGAAPCLTTPASPPPCGTGDSCKAAPSPQPAIFGAPPSATFSGTGNIVPSVPKSVVTPKRSTRVQKLAKALRACGKKPKGRRSACKAQARKRYGTKVKATGNKSERSGK
jgi:hypothetical protein